MRKTYSKIMAAGILTCALTGFATAGSPASEACVASRSIGIMEMPQEAEAALLSNPPAPMVVIEPAAEPQEQPKLYTEADVDMLARLIYTEARGVESRTEQAAVVCDRRESSEPRSGESECVLNRLDNPDRPENSIAEVVTAPFQFDYRSWVPATDEFRELAADVLERWQTEKQGEVEVGRVLPAEYQFFEGDGKRNHFTAEWKSDEFWDWSLPSPYED